MLYGKKQRQGFPSSKLTMTPRKANLKGKQSSNPQVAGQLDPAPSRLRIAHLCCKLALARATALFHWHFWLWYVLKKRHSPPNWNQCVAVCIGTIMGKWWFTSRWNGGHCFQTNRDKPKQSCSDTALHCMDIGLLIWLGVETPCGSGAWHPTLRVIAWNSITLPDTVDRTVPGTLWYTWFISPFFQRLP